MAAQIDFIDGFEDYPAISTAGVGLASQWNVSNAGQMSIVAGRVGGQAMRFGIGEHSAFRTLINPHTKLSGFFAFYWDEADTVGETDIPFMSIRNTTNAHFKMVTNFLRDFAIMGPAGTIIARVPNKIFLRTYYSIAWTWESHDSLGTIKVWLNGELIINLANIDTRNAAGANGDRIYFENVTNRAFVYDDVRVDTDSLTQIPEGRFATATISSDDSVQWTKNGGATNYSRIADATTDQDTTYNSSNTVGHRDVFGLTALGFNPDSIMAVVVSVCARKEDVATRRINAFIISNGVEADSPDMFLSTNYVWNRKIYELNPDGDVPWIKSALTALKVGYELLE